MKYSKEILEEAVRKSISTAGVLRLLGLRPSGGTHDYIKKRIFLFKIDVSHFLGQGYARGKTSPLKKKWSDVLIKRISGTREKAVVLRRALIESGREYICELCGLKPFWNGKELRLHIDHKSTNWLDDTSENLRFVCPNCHSQTDGYNGLKGFSEVVTRRKASRYYRAKKRIHSLVGKAIGS